MDEFVRQHRNQRVIAYPAKIEGFPVWVGPSPIASEIDGLTAGTRHFSVVVNVNDSPELTFLEEEFPPRHGGDHLTRLRRDKPPLRIWLPIYEPAPWPYATLHAIIHVLHHHAVRMNRDVYLHCAGGVNRSPTAATLWLIAEGLSRADAIKASGYSHAFTHALEDGSLPPRVEEFARLTLLLPQKSAIGVLMEVDQELVKAGYRAMKAARPVTYDNLGSSLSPSEPCSG